MLTFELIDMIQKLELIDLSKIFSQNTYFITKSPARKKLYKFKALFNIYFNANKFML